MFSRTYLRQLDTWIAAPSRQREVPGTRRGFRPAVTLNALPGTVGPDFAGRLGEYLASVDDDEPAGWRGFSLEALMELATHSFKSLGGVVGAQSKPCDGCSCPGNGCSERRGFESAVALAREFARRGGCVLQFPGACHLMESVTPFNVWLEASDDYRISARASAAECDRATAAEMLADRLRVEQRWTRHAEGWAVGGVCSCHAAFCLDQMEEDLLVPIIGDTVMEWAAARERETARVALEAIAHDLRGESDALRSRDTGKVLRFSRAGL